MRVRCPMTTFLGKTAAVKPVLSPMPNTSAPTDATAIAALDGLRAAGGERR